MVYDYTIPRGPVAAAYNSPGPIYSLPGLVGQPRHDPRSVHRRGPAYPFGIRHGKFRDDSSPGPCYYPPPNMYRDGRDAGQQYSLYGRRKDGTMFQPPGPGAYKAENAMDMVYPKAAAISFGGPYHKFRTDNTPGANCYSLDPMMGRTVNSKVRSAPSYTQVGRKRVGGFHEDLQKTPGPGAYSVTAPRVYKRAPPSYSLTSRNLMPSDSTKKPGPGAHWPKYRFTRRSAPDFSFGIRHTQYKGEFMTKDDLNDGGC